MNHEREIERKFLVNLHKLSTRQLTVLKPLVISQGYIHETDPLVRVRLVNILTEPKAYITFKGPGFLSRVEIEDEILPGKALEIFKFAKYTLEKIRFRYNRWEIDCFKGDLEGLWLAEIELKSEDEEVELPEWVEKEVTEDPRYCNVALAKHGRPQ